MLSPKEFDERFGAGASIILAMYANEYVKLIIAAQPDLSLQHLATLAFTEGYLYRLEMEGQDEKSNNFLVTHPK